MKDLALIVGVNGQDGTLLLVYLQEKGYDVIGIGKNYYKDHRSGVEKSFDICCPDEVNELLREQTISEIYFLAAVHNSSEKTATNRENSYSVNCVSPFLFLQAIHRFSINTRFFYASSSLVYETCDEKLINESTLPSPNSPYGYQKLYSTKICEMFRREFGIFASVGILFNHESVLRSSNFLSMKVVRGALAAEENSNYRFKLGNYDSWNDWGYAPEFVEAMYLILQHHKPDNFVIATGEKHSVREFAALAFGALELDYLKHIVEDDGVIIGSRQVKIGNIGKIEREIGWSPNYKFGEMISMLISECKGEI